MTSGNYEEMTAEELLAAPRGTRVVDTHGDRWQKQGGTDSWKMHGTTGLRTTSARLYDLWSPLVVIPPEGLSGK